MVPESPKDRLEPEVTPEMIEAAHDVLEDHYFGAGQYDLSDAVMTQLYRAMVCTRSLSRSPDHQNG